MSVFVLVMMDDFSKKLWLETFTSLELALTRAVVLTKETYSVSGNENPVGHFKDDGRTVEYLVWTDESVLVTVLKQEVRSALPHFRGDHAKTLSNVSVGVSGLVGPSGPAESAVPTGLIGPTGPTGPDHFVGVTGPVGPGSTLSPKDNPYDPHLPGGWDYLDKPVSMDVLLSCPEDVKPTTELSGAKQWALVTARISKRPHYTFYDGTITQAEALEELKNKSMIGFNILDDELALLDRLREDILSSNKEYDEE